MDTVLNIGLNDETAGGLARLTNDERFAWDAYRRLVQMYGGVVMGVDDEPFEHVLAEFRARRGLENDADLPVAFAELSRIAKLLEKHYRDVQDIEFTIEKTKLWMLQTRDAKRTALAAVRIAIDLAESRLITREEAVKRVKPEHVDFFLHPQFDLAGLKAARSGGRASSTRGSGASRGAFRHPPARLGTRDFEPRWGCSGPGYPPYRESPP